MPRLTGVLPKSNGGTGSRGWMAEVQEGWMEQSAKRSAADGQPPNTICSQTARTLPQWHSLAPVGVMWSVCQLEALLHPSLSLLDVCCRLFLVGLLWVVLGCCICALGCRLSIGRSQAPLRCTRWVAEEENMNEEHLWMSQSSRGAPLPLAVALADSLLLCVLQEPLPDPRMPHIKALISRLKSVGDTLERAGTAAGLTLEEVDRGSTLTDRLKLICTYIQQRTVSLRALVQAQGDLEASVKDMLQGLDCLWAQLEELHTGVTLTKEGSEGRVAVASAQTHTETLFTVLGSYRIKLQSCQGHLKDSTQLLQELTWSHAQVSTKVTVSGESVWPEVLLQSNMEQFDKVQECFNAVEQQISTFRAHLEGLGKANQKEHTILLGHAKVSRSTSEPHHAPPPRPNSLADDASLERRGSASSTRSAPSASQDTKTGSDSSPSLYRRSALQISSTLDCLRRSGRKK